MRIKLDEALPVSLAVRLSKLGFDADTVVDEGLAGTADPALLVAATADDRMIFTLDRGFGNIQTYPPGSHVGIVVFRLDHQSAQAATQAVERLVQDHDLADLRGTVTVVHRGLLRIRRHA